MSDADHRPEPRPRGFSTRAILAASRAPRIDQVPTSVHTMVVHPPSTSQRQLSEAELEKAGIIPGLLRVSVGLEDLEDLQADFGAALAAAHGATAAAREPLVPAVGAI